MWSDWNLMLHLYCVCLCVNSKRAQITSGWPWGRCFRVRRPQSTTLTTPRSVTSLCPPPPPTHPWSVHAYCSCHSLVASLLQWPYVKRKKSSVYTLSEQLSMKCTRLWRSGTFMDVLQTLIKDKSHVNPAHLMPTVLFLLTLALLVLESGKECPSKAVQLSSKGCFVLTVYALGLFERQKGNTRQPCLNYAKLIRSSHSHREN